MSHDDTYTSQPLTRNYSPVSGGPMRTNHSFPVRQFDSQPGRVELGMHDRQQQPTVWSAVNYPHEEEFSFDAFWLRYERQAEARAIIDKPVDDVWQDTPSAVDAASDSSGEAETEFEEDVEELLAGDHTWRRPIHRLAVADKLARLGEFSLIVLGFDDGRDLSTPVQGVEDDEESGEFDGLDDLQYIATFGQDRVVDWDVDTDMTSPRFRRPETYEVITEEDPEHENDPETQEIHWTRVLHVPEGELEDDLRGTPALKPVFHELLNLDKVKAAAGEGYWRAGYQGLVIRPPEVVTSDGQRRQGTFSDGGDGVKEQIDEFLNNFNREIATTGHIETIDSNVIEPSDFIDAFYQAVEVALDIPRSQFVGSDRADTADTRNATDWQIKVGQRRNGHATVNLFEPLVERLIDAGVLTEPSGDGFSTEWPPLEEKTEKEEAEILQMEIESRAEASPNGDLTHLWSDHEIRQMFGDHPERGQEVDDEFVDEFGPGAEEDDDAEAAEAELQVDEQALGQFQSQQPVGQQQPGQQQQAAPDGGEEQ